MRGGKMIAFLALPLCPAVVGAAAPQPEAVMTIAGIPGQMIIRVDQTDWSQIQGMPDPRTPQLSTVGDPLTSRAGSPLISRGGASGAGSGRAAYQDVSVEKYIDKASPKMALACASGEIIPKVTIEIIPTGQDQRSRFVITMTGVVISQIVEQPATGRDRPFETVTFTCESLTWESQPASATWRVSTPPYTVTPRPR